ncbi:MAG TPA: hypothetical protein VGB91_15600, partial [Rhizomicrobium sp.]
MLLRPDAFARPSVPVPPVPAARVRDDDIAAFQRDGVICLRQTLSQDDVATLAGALDGLSQRIGTSAAG